MDKGAVMDITIYLYSISDEPNKVKKTLSTEPLLITGKLKEEQDITAPAITLTIPEATVTAVPNRPSIVSTRPYSATNWKKPIMSLTA